MPTPSHATNRISGPAELLDAIPYLFGFHPADSLVLVGMCGAMLGPTARLDLADTGQPDLIEDTVSALRRGGADRLVIAVFDDDCEQPARKPWRDAVAAVDEAAAGIGVEIAEALLVCRGRWWTYLCDAVGCCPVRGNPLVSSPSPFAAAAAYDGMVALPSREALAGTLEPLPTPRRDALEPLLAAAEQARVAAALADRAARHERSLVRELLLTARISTAPGWQPPTDTIAARLADALSAPSVRDEVWIAIDAGRLDGQPLWTDLARRCPVPYDAAPLFLLAWGSWRAGHGALAAMAAERAVLSDPGYSAADLLLAAVAQAIDPRSFPRLTDAGLVPGLRAPRRRGRRAGAARRPR